MNTNHPDPIPRIPTVRLQQPALMCDLLVKSEQSQYRNLVPVTSNNDLDMISMDELHPADRESPRVPSSDTTPASPAGPHSASPRVPIRTRVAVSLFNDAAATYSYLVSAVTHRLPSLPLPWCSAGESSIHSIPEFRTCAERPAMYLNI